MVGGIKFTYTAFCNTTSDVAIVSEESFPQLGEISLAHNGILFLDKLPAFQRSVLEIMRQTLGNRVIAISLALVLAEAIQYRSLDRSG